MTDSSVYRPRLTVTFARLIGATNLVFVILGISRLLSTWSHAHVILHQISDRQFAVPALYVLWSVNVALLGTLAAGSVFLLGAPPKGIRLCSLAYICEIAYWIVVAFLPRFFHLVIGIENQSRALDFTMVAVFGNSGIEPQLAAFYPFPALVTIILLSRWTGPLMGMPLALGRPVD